METLEMTSFLGLVEVHRSIRLTSQRDVDNDVRPFNK